MKRIFYYILLFTIILLILTGCKGAYKDQEPNEQNDGSDYLSEHVENTVPNRK